MLARVPLMAGNNSSIWKLRSCPVANLDISPRTVNEVAIVEFATMNSPRLVNTGAMSAAGGGKREKRGRGWNGGSIYSIQLILRRVTAPPPHPTFAIIMIESVIRWC